MNAQQQTPPAERHSAIWHPTARFRMRQQFLKVHLQPPHTRAKYLAHASITPDFPQNLTLSIGMSKVVIVQKARLKTAYGRLTLPAGRPPDRRCGSDIINAGNRQVVGHAKPQPVRRKASRLSQLIVGSKDGSRAIRGRGGRARPAGFHTSPERRARCLASR